MTYAFRVNHGNWSRTSPSTRATAEQADTPDGADDDSDYGALEPSTGGCGF